MNVLIIKQLFTGLLFLCCCLTLINAEPRKETEALLFGHPVSVNFNPIDFAYPQQLQQRIQYQGNCYPDQRDICQQLQYLQQSVANLEEGRRNDYKNLAYLIQTITSVNNDVSYLKKSLSRCPSTAPVGAKVIGTYCYWIGKTKKNLEDASNACLYDGGSLVEPWPAFGPVLYTSLVKAFPATFYTIGLSSPLWIGADNQEDKPTYQNIDHILYLTTNEYVPGEPVNALPYMTTIRYGATLTTTSTFYYMVHTTLNNYVCWATAL